MHSDNLEKFEIGERIRKQLDEMLYDGEIVLINLGKKFYRIWYIDGDEEDMTVSDVQIFWIANEVDQKKR